MESVLYGKVALWLFDREERRPWPGVPLAAFETRPTPRVTLYGPVEEMVALLTASARVEVAPGRWVQVHEISRSAKRPGFASGIGHWFTVA